MKVEIFDFPIQSKLKKKVDSLLNDCFGLKPDATPERIEANQNNYYSNPVKYILYSNGEDIIGIQMIFLREVSFENQNVLIGGLGGLCVDEKYRNQGIATKLLSEAMEILKELNCDISILFTDIDYPPYVKLYGRFGFVLLGREYCFMDRVGKTKTNNNAMIAPVNSTDKYNLILDSKEILNIGAGEW